MCIYSMFCNTYIVYVYLKLVLTMPQLIVVPYNHIYVAVTCLLSISFFAFVKYVLPNMLLLNKVILKVILTYTKKYLWYVYIIGLPFEILNKCSLYLNNISFCLDIMSNQMLSCLCYDYTQNSFVCKYSNNNIRNNVLQDILLERLYEDGRSI